MSHSEAILRLSRDVRTAVARLVAAADADDHDAMEREQKLVNEAVDTLLEASRLRVADLRERAALRRDARRAS